MTRSEFEDLVGDALDAIPDRFAELVRNVVVLVEDEAPADDPDLLGLYDGISLVERGADPGLDQPARIFLYRGNLQEMCSSLEELVDEVRTTVVHEVAHHFGIDDARLHALGWG